MLQARTSQAFKASWGMQTTWFRYTPTKLKDAILAEKERHIFSAQSAGSALTLELKNWEELTLLDLGIPFQNQRPRWVYEPGRQERSPTARQSPL